MTKQIGNKPFGDYRAVEIGLDGEIDHDFFGQDNDDVVNRHKSKRETVPSKIEAVKRPLESMEKPKTPRESSKNKNPKEKSQSSSKKSSNQEKVQNKNESNQKAQDYDKKEKEKRDLERREKERRERERREREVLEAERRERELEIERWERERDRGRERGRKNDIPVLVSRYKPRKPPAGYKDPHDVCKQVLPTKVKEEKRQEIKALMNCIAFEPVQADSPTSGERTRGKGKSTIEEMDNSLSSDTTSDITDVTPRSSSSGCSSMSKQSMNMDKPESVKNEDESANNESATNNKRSKSESRTKHDNEIKARKNIKNSVETTATEKGKLDNRGMDTEINGNLNEIELEEMKYLQDAFEDLDVDEQASDFASSIISGLSEERRAKCGRKNMTFTNEQLREIERVNLILLKKIMGHRKPRTKSQSQPPVNRKTSAAINRSRMEEKIERENKILLKKLQTAKGTTGTLSRKATPSPAYY